MLTLSGKLSRLLPDGTAEPVAEGTAVYLLPSRTDFMWTPDGGTTWLPWQKNLELDTAYQNGVKAETNGTGAFSFKVPFSDTEVQLPTGAPLPALVWNVVDPSTGKVYYGPVLSSLGATKTLYL